MFLHHSVLLVFLDIKGAEFFDYIKGARFGEFTIALHKTRSARILSYGVLYKTAYLLSRYLVESTECRGDSRYRSQILHHDILEALSPRSCALRHRIR
jgi:hypothetical protein